MTIKLFDNVINLDYVVEIAPIYKDPDYLKLSIYYVSKDSSSFVFYYNNYVESREEVEKHVIILRDQIRRLISDEQVDLEINLKQNPSTSPPPKGLRQLPNR